MHQLEEPPTAMQMLTEDSVKVQEPAAKSDITAKHLCMHGTQLVRTRYQLFQAMIFNDNTRMTAGVVAVHAAGSSLRRAGDHILGGGAEVQGKVQGLGVVLLQLQAMHEVQRIAGAAGLQLQGSPAGQHHTGSHACTFLMAAFSA